MQKWVLASNNQGKLAEFQALFDDADLGVHIIAQGSLGIGDVSEDGKSFIENAIIKARHAAKVSGLPAVADDSGLCVPPFLATPLGFFSARYAGRHGDDAANNAKLLEQLKPYRSHAPIDAFFCLCTGVCASWRRSDATYRNWQMAWRDT